MFVGRRLSTFFSKPGSSPHFQKQEGWKIWVYLTVFWEARGEGGRGGRLGGAGGQDGGEDLLLLLVGLTM